ncbi:MAG TPA: hypothetical protein GXX51_03500 [Firmicutes bacterium]|nr:hypothetical protein [Bacillota bacterium]
MANRIITVDCLPFIDRESLQPEWRLAAFVDVETTGLSKTLDEIIEIAVELFAFDPGTGEIKGVIEEYVGLREPGCPISEGAARVHGITPRMVKGKRLDDRKILSLCNEAALIVSHNAAFDRDFICKLYPDLAMKEWLCSMRGISWRNKGFRSCSLQNLLQTHNIVTGTSHRAGSDARASVLLLSMRDREGNTYFSELLHKASIPLTDEEKLVLEMIQDLVKDQTTNIGWHKTTSYVAVGLEDGAYWFIRFKWGPKAKYIVLRQSTDLERERIDVTGLESIKEYAEAIRAACLASIRWHDMAEQYKGRLGEEVVSEISARDLLKAHRTRDRIRKPVHKRSSEKTAAAGSGCMGCLLPMIVVLMVFGLVVCVYLF